MKKKDIDVSEILSQYSHEELENLVFRMREYVENKINFKEKNIDGLEALDFVMSVFEKSLTGIRNWEPEKCNFEYFVFGVLKSEVSSVLRKRRRRLHNNDDYEKDEDYILDMPVVGAELLENDTGFQEMDYEQQKKLFLKLLTDAGSDTMELMIFECWCDNIYKPNEIAELLDSDVATIYKAQKRLQRRKKKIIQIDE